MVSRSDTLSTRVTHPQPQHERKADHGEETSNPEEAQHGRADS